METLEVLIADDSPLVLKIITKALLENSFSHYAFESSKIHCAQDGMEAFEMIGKNKNISMLISDINMPHLNGDELVEILVDTGLHKKMQTVFITTDESKIKSTIKKHSIGTIVKPFNPASFATALNDIFVSHHETKKDISKKKTKYTSHITRALKEVFHTYAISPKSHHGLDELIEHYLDEIHESSDEEIEFVFYAILEEFIQSQGQSVPLDYTTLKVIWNNTIHTKKSFTLALIPCMHDAIESCRELLSEKKEVSYHAIVKELTTPLHDKVFIIRSKVNAYQPSKHLYYSALLEHIVERFEALDPLIMDEYLTELLTYKYEMEEFIGWMKEYCKSNQLESDFPQLKKSPHLFKEVYSKYLHNITVLNKMQYFIVGEIEKYLLSRLFRSKKCTQYLKQHMNNAMPTTGNILFHLQKLHAHDHRRLSEHDTQNVVLLSLNTDFLMRFKAEYEQKFPHMKIFCFTKTQHLENWIESNHMDKFIVDYDFSTNIFQTGLVYLKYFFKHMKKNKSAHSLYRYNHYYLLGDYAKVMKEKENLGGLKPHIIKKPLTAQDVKDILVYS